MGRYKRKKHQKSTNGSSNGSTTTASRTLSSSSSLGMEERQEKKFTAKDRKLLTQYLQEYQDCAYRVYNGMSKKRQEVESDEPVIIGGVTFPMLTDDALRQPTLSLPKELSSKQRKVVHQYCCDGEHMKNKVDGGSSWRLSNYFLFTFIL